VLLELVRPRLEILMRAWLVLEALGELAHQDDALLEQPEARPDRGLDGSPLLQRKALGRVLVADPAAKGDDVVAFRAPDRTAALRAREAGRLARLGVLVGLFGDFQGVIHRGHSSFEVFIFGWIVRKFNYERSELGGAAYSIRGCVLDRALGHARVERGLGILDEANAAVGFDRTQSERPVVEGAGEDHADGTRPESMGGRAEERVDGGAMAILLRARHRDGRTVVQLDVAVGRGHEDPAARDLDVVADVLRRQRARSGQYLGEDTRAAGRQVEDDKDRRRQVPGASATQFR